MIQPDQIKFTYRAVGTRDHIFSEVTGQHKNVVITVTKKEYFLLPGLGRLRAERKVAKLFGQIEVLDYAK